MLNRLISGEKTGVFGEKSRCFGEETGCFGESWGVLGRLFLLLYYIYINYELNISINNVKMFFIFP